MQHLLTTLAGILTAIVTFFHPAAHPATHRFGGLIGIASDTPSYFAQIDKNGIVQRVIVIRQTDIDTGNWGDPKSFVQTSLDGSVRKYYAGVGYSYDATSDTFFNPQTSGLPMTFNTTTNLWIQQPTSVVDSSVATPTSPTL